MLNTMKDFNIKNGRGAMVIFLSIVLALLVFKLGVYVGIHEARFSDMQGNRGIPPNMPFMPFPMSEQFTSGHGATGRVVGVSLPNFVVASPDNFEKVIFVGPGTMIRKFRDSVGPDSIDVDDFVSVLGNPTASGSIDAKFIRIMPR